MLQYRYCKVHLDWFWEKIPKNEVTKGCTREEISKILSKIDEIKLFGMVHIELSRCGWTQNDHWHQGYLLSTNVPLKNNFCGHRPWSQWSFWDQACLDSYFFVFLQPKAAKITIWSQMVNSHLLLVSTVILKPNTPT